MVYKVDWKQENKDRLKRAESWYKHGCEMSDGSDEQFLFLWIAFDAAYGSESDLPSAQNRSGSTISKKKRFKRFVNKLIIHDDDEKINKLLSEKGKLILKLLGNPYISEPFWEHIRNNTRQQNWKGQMRSSLRNFKKKPERDRTRDNIEENLGEILKRLSTLRNQIVHGGKTYGTDSWGKRQLRDGCKIMRPLVDLIIEIMGKNIKKNPNTIIWQRVAYPRIEEEPQLK